MSQVSEGVFDAAVREQHADSGVLLVPAHVMTREEF